MSIEAKVKKIMAELLGMDEVHVGLDSSLEDDLGADSLDVVEVCMAIEEEFSIEVGSEDEENCKTVKDWIDVVEKMI